MALNRGAIIFKSIGSHNLKFSTSSLVSNKWRLQQGLESEPRRFSPLSLLPDYTFVDGRPTPLSYRKKQKVEYQKKLCQRIIELNHELDVGLQQFYDKKKEKEEQKKAIIQNKLKPKGAALLKKKGS